MPQLRDHDSVERNSRAYDRYIVDTRALKISSAVVISSDHFDKLLADRRQCIWLHGVGHTTVPRVRAAGKAELSAVPARQTSVQYDEIYQCRSAGDAGDTEKQSATLDKCAALLVRVSSALFKRTGFCDDTGTDTRPEPRQFGK